MLELKFKPITGTFQESATERQQPRKQLLALVLLLVTFAALIVKDHDFWFGPDDSTDSDIVTADAATPARPRTVTPNVRQAAPVAGSQANNKKKAASQTATTVAASPAADESQPSGSDVIATNRTALRPLDVEVVAGDKHSRIHPGSNSTKLEITSDQPAGPATSAAEREAISTTVPATAGTAGDSYPMLAQQTKVQGSVVLQAIIGADGNIQDLRVLAGPSILTSAAQQAVRQWRFKPYMQNGQPVETKARITVNFTIHVGENSPKIS
jgi:TonB family protein